MIIESNAVDGTVPATVATATVKSAWASKTNWSAAVGTALELLNQYGGLVPPKYQPYVTVSVALLTFVSVAFFHTTSTTITPTAAKTAPGA